MNFRSFRRAFLAFAIVFFFNGLAYGQTEAISWSANGSHCCFQRQDSDGGKQFVLVELESQAENPAFDHQKVGEGLAELLNRKVDPKNLPIQSIEFAKTAEHFLLQCGSQEILLDPKTSELKKADVLLQSRFFLPPRQGRGSGETNVVIENQTGKPLELLWYGFDNQEQSFGRIASNEKREQHTYIGHVWMIKIGGELKGCFEAERDDYVVIDNESFENVNREKRQSSRRSGRSRRGRGASSSRVSPDGKTKATVRDHDLWLSPNGKGAGIGEANSEDFRLTTNGSNKFTFQNIGSGTRWANLPSSSDDQPSVRWSPDSTYLVAFQTKRVEEPRVHYIESTNKNGLQPQLRSYSYAKPGDDLLLQTLRLFSVKTHKEVPVSNELFANSFWTRFLGWSKSGDSFRLLYNQRGHQVMRLLEVSVTTGEVRIVIEERSETFIQYSDRGKSVFEALPNDEILWASERSGWNHLYRFDGKSGKLLNAVTKGDWNVKRIVEINREENLILFYAVGVYANQDPYHEHLCRVNFDGSGFQILTSGDGTHRVKFVQDGKYFLDTYSRVDLAPVSELHAMGTGKLIAEVSREDTSKRFGRRRLTERFVAKGRDGETDIWGIIHWPLNFDSDKNYPVVEYIYAGPHDHHVPKSFQTRYGHQHSIADAGMIVVQIDGMGTAWRSKAFHDVCFKNLRDAGFPDRIAWVKAAAKKFPQMDISRVGIYGGSAGGQNAMAALLWHNDFYKVAVADCGCHDNRMDKIWWNEQWMGVPGDGSYIKNSNMENARLLKGHLMLTVGELDQNVDPATTTQVVHELIKYDKDFEYVLIAGRGHGAGETPWAAKKRLKFLKQHLGVE